MRIEDRIRRRVRRLEAVYLNERFYDKELIVNVPVVGRGALSNSAIRSRKQA